MSDRCRSHRLEKSEREAIGLRNPLARLPEPGPLDERPDVLRFVLVRALRPDRLAFVQREPEIGGFDPYRLTRSAHEVDLDARFDGVPHRAIRIAVDVEVS